MLRTFSELIKADDAIDPDNNDSVIIGNPPETITTDRDSRTVIQPEFKVGTAVVADFNQHYQKTPPQGLQGIRNGQSGKIIKVKTYHDRHLEYWVLFEGLTKERAVPSMFVALAKEAIAPKDSTDETVLEQSEITTIIRIGDRVRLQIPAAAEVAEHDGREGWVMQELPGSQDVDILIDGFQNEHYTLTSDRSWLSLIEVSPLHIGDVVRVVRGFPKHHTSGIQNLNPKERKLWLESGRGKWIPFDAVKRFDTLKEASEVKRHLPEATTQAGVIETEALPSLPMVLEDLEIAKEFRFEPLRQDADVLQGCLF